jgi:hypothetical protein
VRQGAKGEAPDHPRTGQTPTANDVERRMFQEMLTLPWNHRQWRRIARICGTFFILKARNASWTGEALTYPMTMPHGTKRKKSAPPYANENKTGGVSL